MTKQNSFVYKIIAFSLTALLFASAYGMVPFAVYASPEKSEHTPQNASEQTKETAQTEKNSTNEKKEKTPAQPADSLGLTAKAAVLMNAETGKIIYSVNENQQLPEASITKIMTMLLVFEALDAEKITMEDSVTCSEYAASMGG